MKKKKGKRKISFLKVFVVFLLGYLLFTGIYNFVTLRTKNIYVIGNNYLSDKYIIEKASLSNYPPFFLTFSSGIKKKLLNDNLIYDVKVKKGLFSIYLYIDENTPLFYDSSSNETILFDGTKVSYKYDCPILNSYVPDTIYDTFIAQMKKVNVLDRISEIDYVPNVDNKRFCLTMNDGNYVYLTLDEFLKINDYVDALKILNGKKGTVYWDSGNFFYYDK